MAGSGNRTQIAGTAPGNPAPEADLGWEAIDEEAVPTPVRPRRGTPAPVPQYGRAGGGPSQGPSGLELAELEDAREGQRSDDDLEAAIPTAWSPQRPAAAAAAVLPRPAADSADDAGEEFDFAADRSAPPSASVQPPRDLGSLSPPGAGAWLLPASETPGRDSGTPGTELSLGGAPSPPPAARGPFAVGPHGTAAQQPGNLFSEPADLGEPLPDLDRERTRIGRGDSMAALDLDQRARPAHLDLGADLELDSTALVEARRSRRAMARTAERGATEPRIPRAAPVPVILAEAAPAPSVAPALAFPEPELALSPNAGRPAPAPLGDDGLALPSAPPTSHSPALPSDDGLGLPSAPPVHAGATHEVPELEVPLAPRFARPVTDDRGLSSRPPEGTSAASGPPGAPGAPGDSGAPRTTSGADELASDRPQHPPRSPVPTSPPTSFDMDLDEVPGDPAGAALEIASAPGASPGAAPDGKPLPTGRTPDAAALGVTRDQAVRLARFGEPPAGALLAPAYAARVLVRRQQLAAEAKAARAALTRAERDRDLVLAEVFVKFRDQLNAVVKLPEQVEPPHGPEAEASGQRREFAQVSAEYQQRQRGLTVRATHADQVVAALRQAQSARAEVHAQRQGEFNRVAARFQRLQIERRNARQAEGSSAPTPIARASNPPPNEAATQTARIELQLGKLYPVAKRLQAAMEEAERELHAAEQATREAEGRIKLIEAERKAVDLWYARETRHVDASLAAAEGAYVTARADVVRTALSIGSAHLPVKTLDLLRDQDDRVRELAAASHRLELALASVDADRYRQGLVSGLTLLAALLLVILLLVLF